MSLESRLVDAASAAQSGIMVKVSWMLIAAALAILDYFTKMAVPIILDGSGELPIMPFVNVVSTRNSGVSFGMLSFLGVEAIMSITAILVCVMMLMVLLHRGDKSEYNIAGIAIVLGGALGNFIDRFHHRSVYDFIDLYVVINGRYYHWPAFNFADICIFVGVSVMVLYRCH